MKKYVIKKDHHFSFSLFHFGITFSNRVKCMARFESSCLYDLPDKHDYNHNMDINKLFGFSTTYNHHNQSARIGWRCLDGKSIQLVTYTYRDHVRMPEQVLGTVMPDEAFECSIEDIETDYIYIFKQIGKPSTIIKVPKKEDCVLFKYMLFPYFGGNFTAPHDMVIHLERL